MNNMFEVLKNGDLKDKIEIAIDREYGNYITITAKNERKNPILLYREPAYKLITSDEFIRTFCCNCRYLDAYKYKKIKVKFDHDEYTRIANRKIHCLIDFAEYFTTGGLRGGKEEYEKMALKFEEITKPKDGIFKGTEYAYLDDVCRFEFKGTKGTYRNSTYEIIDGGIRVARDGYTLTCTASMLWNVYYVSVEWKGELLNSSRVDYIEMHELLKNVLKEIFDEKFSGMNL